MWILIGNIFEKPIFLREKLQALSKIIKTDIKIIKIETYYTFCFNGKQIFHRRIYFYCFSILHFFLNYFEPRPVNFQYSTRI